MYIKKRKEPSTLPCGTPQVIIGLKSDCLVNFDTL